MSTIESGNSANPVGERVAKGRLVEQHRRSIAKTVSWRTIGSLDTMLVSFLVFWFMRPSTSIDVAKCASFVGVFEVPNKLFLYYLHERVWSRIKWGLVPPEPEYEI